MNFPNRLTFYRIFLTLIFIPLIFTQGLLPKAFALATFMLASFTDYWDGKVAREKGQTSRFGKLMDPIADKVLTLSAFIAFVSVGLIPAWTVFLILIRDFAVTGWRLFLPLGEDSQSARGSGKHKTVLQFAWIAGVLLFLVARETSGWRPEWTSTSYRFIYLSMCFIVAVTLWTGVRYILKNQEALNEQLG